MLSEEICWIDFATDLAELYGLIAHALLYPETLRVDVAQFAEPLTATNAHRRRLIRPGSDLHFLA